MKTPQQILERKRCYFFLNNTKSVKPSAIIKHGANRGKKPCFQLSMTWKMPNAIIPPAIYSDNLCFIFLPPYKGYILYA